MEPLRPLSAGTLHGIERKTIINIVGGMIDANFKPDLLKAHRDAWVDDLASAFSGPEGWARLWQEVRRWVYWTQDVGYWLSDVFERGCLAHATGLRGMALALKARANETVGDDSAAHATLEQAYAWAQGSWPETERPDQIATFLVQVTGDLRMYDWYYRDTATPGTVDRHNPLLFNPYNLHTWATLRQAFDFLPANTWQMASLDELSAVVDLCKGPEYDYFRPIARRFLAARLATNKQRPAAAEQLQLALDDARGYGDGEPATYLVPLTGGLVRYLHLRVNLTAEIGHLLRQQTETLGALGRWADAERSAQAATEHEAFYQSSYWRALSAKRLGHLKVLRGDTAGALAAYAQGREAFDLNMMLTKIPAARSAKQHLTRRYVEGAVAFADLAGQTEAVVAEYESAAPVGPSEELGELLVALKDDSISDMQALRAIFYEYLAVAPNDFDSYLQNIPARQQQRHRFRALWDHNHWYRGATTMATASDIAAAQFCRTARPDSTAVLHHSGLSGTMFTAVMLDGTAKSHSVQESWGERQIFDMHARFRDEVESATSAEGRSAAIRRLVEAANEMLGPPMRKLLPYMAGRHVKFFPRAQLTTIPLHAVYVEGIPLIDHCDVSYGTTVRQLSFPREAFGAESPGRQITFIHDMTNTKYLAGAAIELENLFGNSAEILTNPDITTALRAIGRVDGDLVVACHGVFDAEHPGAGYLEIGQSPWLTFETLFSSVALRRCRTVMLAACTSAVSRATIAAELVGLPAMLLAAGAHYVIGSSWQVNELATAILLSIYLAHAKQGTPAVHAFNQAQREVAAATLDDVREWCTKNLPTLAEPVHRALSVLGRVPFRSPEYWAGFSITGDF